MAEETQTNREELVERLKLIESMMAEGRHMQESWGWTFVLWGVAYFVAFFWAWLGQFAYAWPVTMLAAGVVTSIVLRRRRRRGPVTTLGRAISSIWTAAGLSMFLVLCAMGYSPYASNGHAMIAAFAGMLGLTNAACGMTLRWKAQMLCALLWWATAVAACYCADALLLPILLIAVFFGQIVFGGAMVLAELRRNKRSGAVHA